MRARAAALAFASLGAGAAGAEEAGPSGVSFYGLVGLDVASTKRSDATPRALAMQSAGLNAPFWAVG
ncbi:MAG: hypothetical protein MO847_06035 [Candidatus Protistobacter heckmanni]|nr:hypothetical protein [Candidatus Protistobacter heckmanni]